jgi:glutathione S-transferase
MRGGATDEALVEVYGIQLDKALAVYDVILAKQPYLAGEELTLADLFHIPYGAMARRIGYEETFNKYPHVKKWFDGLEARESWVKANLSGDEKKIVEKKAE